MGITTPPEYLPQFEKYMRFLTTNFGLSGLLGWYTPREVIEGYYDPLIETLNSMPIYEGGDSTTSPFLAMNIPPTHPSDNTVAFFTGEEDYTMTRTYGTWLDSPFINMKGKQYTSINKIEDYLFSPWSEDVLLDGTDGMQFAPDQQDSGTIKVFVNDLSRNCYFDYDHVDDRYPHLDTYIYNIQYDLMRNMTDYPPNKKYDVRVTGTSNMTSSLLAYSFVSKGHYYQLAEAAEESKPKMVYQNNTVIEPIQEEDDTYLGVEKYSGVCMIAMERIFFNMAIYGDELFNFGVPGDNGWFFPLAYVKRESEWTQD